MEHHDFSDYEHLREQLAPVLSLEERLPRQHLGDDASERPHINRPPKLQTEEHLRRAVAQRLYLLRTRLVYNSAVELWSTSIIM